MEISSGRHLWLVPPQFAVWVPAKTFHNIRMLGPVTMRTLYFQPRIASGLPGTCEVFHVASLLRELILEAVRIGKLRHGNPLERALRDLVIHYLKSASSIPTALTMPTDARALTVARAALDQQAEAPNLDCLCATAGVSPRTIERAFKRDLGINFESWRRQARLTKSIELLFGGCSTKETAYQVGYRQPSAFVEMFRRAMGKPPKEWLAGF
jgi:AraC-like DNA-binding protein